MRGQGRKSVRRQSAISHQGIVFFRAVRRQSQAEAWFSFFTSYSGKRKAANKHKRKDVEPEGKTVYRGMEADSHFCEANPRPPGSRLDDIRPFSDSQ